MVFCLHNKLCAETVMVIMRAFSTNFKCNDWNMVHNFGEIFATSTLDIIVNMNSQTNCHNYRTGYLIRDYTSPTKDNMNQQQKTIS